MSCHQRYQVVQYLHDKCDSIRCNCTQLTYSYPVLLQPCLLMHAACSFALSCFKKNRWICMVNMSWHRVGSLCRSKFIVLLPRALAQPCPTMGELLADNSLMVLFVHNVHFSHYSLISPWHFFKFLKKMFNHIMHCRGRKRQTSLCIY